MTDHPEFEPLLSALLDGELDAANALKCEQHLASCPACSAKYAQMAALQTAIRGADLRTRAPERLQRRVVASVRRAHLGAREFARALGWPAAALMAASLCFFALTPRQTDIGDELVSSHVQSMMANHLIDIASSDHHMVKPWFAGHIDFSPPVYDLAEQGYPLAGGRVDYVDGHAVAAVVYRRGAHVINLFIWPAHEGGAGSALPEVRQGYNVVHWTKLGMSCWAVSDLNLRELQQFEQLVRTQNPV
jgi:anti-sigma factor RsiW